jgi:hypothetical protein
MHQVSAVLGTHIEMSKTPGMDFPMGSRSTFQPNEAPLPLTEAELLELDQELQKAGDDPRKIVLPKCIVTPFSADAVDNHWLVQRALSSKIDGINGESSKPARARVQ